MNGLNGIGSNSSAIEERYRVWSERAEEFADELKAMEQDVGEIRDRFGRDLEFGTGGLRGVLGVGTNRMNRYVVRRATLGLASYIKKAGLPGKVAVSYDSRINSRLFAEETAKTLATCGLDAWVYPRLEPTPALSWAVRALGCGGGVMITASHNPAEYNGYKVYGPDGCQITDFAAAAILREINSFGYFEDLAPVDDKKLHDIPELVLDEFVNTELKLTPMRLDSLKVVYTPMNGTGLECVKRSLLASGVEELYVVPEQELPDGNFPTCPSPNPEKKEAMELGLQLFERRGADILLATDPDCDRVGVAVRSKNGYCLLNGNEIGVLLLDYICKIRRENGTMPQAPVAVTTIVSTEMASAVAEHYGVELRKTLTGFKYIGEQIGELEKAGSEDRYIFGFEESYGYLTAGHVRDKDGVNASLMICAMAAYYKKLGKTLAEALEELHGLFGTYAESLHSIDFKGIDGLSTMREILKNLRGDAVAEIAGVAVCEVVDYLDNGATGLPASDVLQFRLENGDRIVIRPSGTEPKMKLYFSVQKNSKEECAQRIRALTEAMLLLVQA